MLQQPDSSQVLLLDCESGRILLAVGIHPAALVPASRPWAIYIVQSQIATSAM